MRETPARSETSRMVGRWLEVAPRRGDLFLRAAAFFFRDRFMLPVI
jgi:hypothetical protein